MTASRDGIVRVWEVASGEIIALLRGHDNSAFSPKFSPDGERVVTISDDGTARVWDSANVETIAVLRRHEDWVNSAQFSPDGSQLVYESNVDGKSIWLTDIDGNNPHKLADNASLPEWH